MKETAVTLKQRLVDFIFYCRERQFQLSPQQTEDAFKIAEMGLFLNRNRFKYALKAICCSNKEHAERFDEMFDRFWSRGYRENLEEERIKRRSKPNKKDTTSLVWLGGGGGKQKQVNETKQTIGANDALRLRRTDFAKLTVNDAGIFTELSEALYRQMSFRYKRRLDNSNYGVINIRKTIRKSIPKGGMLLDLTFKKKKKEKRKLVFLLDVSGSMDTYSYYLLRFILVLRRYFKQLEFFTFSTGLKRITPLIQNDDQSAVLTHIGNELKEWSGGTKIGQSLTDFVSTYGNRLLTQKHVVVILSDGLETGSIGLLRKAVADIKLRCKTLIWLNPLKGMQGYQPIQKGMLSALPYLDVFESAHNLDSLLKLEKILLDV